MSSAAAPEVARYKPSGDFSSSRFADTSFSIDKPVTFTLTGGQVHDSQPVTALIDRGAIRRIGRGRPRLRPAKLAGDKAYSSRSSRFALRQRGITPVIPTKANDNTVQ